MQFTVSPNAAMNSKLHCKRSMQKLKKCEAGQLAFLETHVAVQDHA